MKYYDEIMQLPDSYDIKKTVRKWQRLSENLENDTQGLQVLLPDLLLVAKNGVGKTHVLRLISEYLASRDNLMEFYGDVKFFEFYLNYCSPGEYFEEIPRLMSEVEAAAGFRSEYKGIICLDVNEWIRHCEEKHFIDLLEYLAANSKYWLVVFCVSDGNAREINNMEAVISMFLRLERTELKLPRPAELLEYISKNLLKYDLVLDESARELLAETIAALRKNKYFDGYKTLDMLICDITYSVYTATGKLKKELTAGDIAAFSADGEYVQKRLLNFETKKRYIGFSEGGAE